MCECVVDVHQKDPPPADMGLKRIGRPSRAMASAAHMTSPLMPTRKAHAFEAFFEVARDPLAAPESEATHQRRSEPLDVALQRLVVDRRRDGGQCKGRGRSVPSVLRARGAGSNRTCGRVI
jgi:hypothetical protein